MNENKKLSDEEELLLFYIDIPYFKNNPSYIERWRRYYIKNRDHQILFLMYYKQISIYFHWIYIELSRHFMKSEKYEIAYFILNEALRLNVYNKDRILEEINKIPEFTKKYTKGDLMSILNQRNIKAIGKTWNSYMEKFYKSDLPEEFSNFETMALLNYEKEYGTLLNKDLNSNIQQEIHEEPHLPDIYSTPLTKQDNIYNIKNDIRGIYEDLMISNELDYKNISTDKIIQEENVLPVVSLTNGIEKDEEAVCVKESIGLSDLESVIEINGILDIGTEISIDKYIYFVRSQEEDSFSLLRIAKNSDITQTMTGKYFLLKKVSEKSLNICQKILKHVSYKYNNEYYTLFENDSILYFKSLNDLSYNLALSYLKQIIITALNLIEHDLIVDDPLDFYIDQDFNLVLNCFEFTIATEENVSKFLTVLQTRFNLSDIEISYEFINQINKKLESQQAKREILKHRTNILENL